MSLRRLHHRLGERAGVHLRRRLPCAERWLSARSSDSHGGRRPPTAGASPAPRSRHRCPSADSPSRRRALGEARVQGKAPPRQRLQAASRRTSRAPGSRPTCPRRRRRRRCARPRPARPAAAARGSRRLTSADHARTVNHHPHRYRCFRRLIKMNAADHKVVQVEPEASTMAAGLSPSNPPQKRGSLPAGENALPDNQHLRRNERGRAARASARAAAADSAPRCDRSALRACLRRCRHSDRRT